MTDTGISRRRLIRGAATATLVLVAARGGQIVMAAEPAAGDIKPVEQLGAHEADTLRRLVRCLFPYRGLGNGPYSLVVEGVQRSADVAQLLREGVALLDAAAKRSTWLQLPKERQVAVLKGIESSEFFQLMLNGSIHGLHSNEELWALVGYQGSSVEHGGYINRGFNDIDWLPQPAG